MKEAEKHHVLPIDDRTVERVIAELHKIKEIWAHPFIEFADDNTFADKRHGLALAEARH